MDIKEVYSAYQQVQEGKKKSKKKDKEKEPRWQDSDGDGKCMKKEKM